MSQVIPGYPVQGYPIISHLVPSYPPKGYPRISQDIPRQDSCFGISHYKFFVWVIPGYPWINTTSGYPGISRDIPSCRFSRCLGKLPLIPVGDTGTIPFSMRDKLHEVDGASCDTKPGDGDGCRSWYVNPCK